MNILFEEDGVVKVGQIRSEADSSAQIELAGGRRIKVKQANILMRFNTPDSASVLAAAQKQLPDVDMMLLWQSAPQGEELGFEDLAREYFGPSANTTEIAVTLLGLQASPMYFYKRGKGRYKAAPEEALNAALAGMERKAREAEQIEAWVNELVNGHAPIEISSQWIKLLHAPDKNSPPFKALQAAADKARMNPVHLLAKAGAIPSTHALHFQRFLLATFPKGTSFASDLHLSDEALAPLNALPLADVQAFSIDDATTTEIDDAFSLTKTANGYRIGIHIAAPALGMPKDSPLDRTARDRLSTVYMPGNKITMLPDSAIAAFSLDEGKTPAAVSLYADLDAELNVVSTVTKIERITMAANLRIGDLDAIDWLDTNNASAQGAKWDTMRLLHQFAKKRAESRGEQANNRVDYSFTIHGNPDAADATVEITTRPRGSAVDTLVSELMIFANVTWAQMLEAKRWPGMFRVQAAGKTKMSSQPGPHEGLGLPCYAWATSPLRRFSDLLNQRQIIAMAEDAPAPYVSGDANMLAAVADFDATYGSYNDFQYQMEQYWCMRYLVQTKTEKFTATTIRENLVRFDKLPLVQRVNDMPNQAPGSQVMLAVAEIDLFEPILHTRFVEVVNAPAAQVAA